MFSNKCLVYYSHKLPIDTLTNTAMSIDNSYLL